VNAAPVRLRGHTHSRVRVPVRQKFTSLKTEGYCVVATRGGELPEVNNPSVTMRHGNDAKVNLIRPQRPANLRALVKPQSGPTEEEAFAPPRRGSGSRDWQIRAKRKRERNNARAGAYGVVEDRGVGSVGEVSRESPWDRTAREAKGASPAAPGQSERP